jgi:hypothetical protein
MDLSGFKNYVVTNPLHAAVVALVAVLASPLVILAATPLVQFIFVQLAHVLVPAILLALVSESYAFEG